MTVPVPVLAQLDQLDDEHQQMMFERLHFLSFLKTLTLKPCRCGEPAPILSPGPCANERRKIECGGCGQYIAWLPKLKNKDRRSSASTGLANGTVCQCCRKTGVSLIGHHVIEVAEGGSDCPENIWTVCEPCHALIHAARRLAQGAAVCAL
jgi:5-methylcytosine-specific restriction endonuclease McrA